jgi:hypothetical protein
MIVFDVPILAFSALLLFLIQLLTDTNAHNTEEILIYPTYQQYWPVLCLQEQPKSQEGGH